jgi:threonine aldolase
MVDRLTEDHARARRLAENLAAIPGIFLDIGLPQTNMLFLSLDPGVPLTANQVAASLAQVGILVSAVSERRFRLVTHFWITDDDISRTTLAFQNVIV